jgi:hypothetical protein
VEARSAAGQPTGPRFLEAERDDLRTAHEASDSVARPPSSTIGGASTRAEAVRGVNNDGPRPAFTPRADQAEVTLPPDSIAPLPRPGIERYDSLSPTNRQREREFRFPNSNAASKPIPNADS